MNTSGNGNGNAVTCISISEGKDITLCKGTSFAKVYNGNDNCVEYANKACVYSGGGVGSSTRGVFIDSDGIPRAMTKELCQTITSDMYLIKKLGNDLIWTPATSTVDIKYTSKSIACGESLPVTAAQVKEYVNSMLG